MSIFYRRDHDDEPNLLRLILKMLAEILAELKRARPQSTKLTIQFEGAKPGMPGILTDTQSISASIAETDAAGQPVTIDPTKVTWTVGDPTISALTQNPDGSASFKALKVGTTSVGVTDSSNGLSAQDTLTVTAGAATTLTIAFGTAS